jgi:hypothetical protein
MRKIRAILDYFFGGIALFIIFLLTQEIIMELMKKVKFVALYIILSCAVQAAGPPSFYGGRSLHNSQPGSSYYNVRGGYMGSYKGTSFYSNSGQFSGSQKNGSLYNKSGAYRGSKSANSGSFYTQTGVYNGRSVTNGSTTSYYNSAGRYMGSQRGSSFYSASGQYMGRVSNAKR